MLHFLFYFLVVVAIVLLKRLELPGRAIYLFRAFFPSWRFFEDFSEVPILSYRVSLKPGEFEPWQLCLEKPARQWKTLFLNAHGNQLLACDSLLVHLVTELEEVSERDKIQESVSFELVNGLVRNQLKNPLRALREYQFKVSSVVPGQTEVPPKDLLISPIYSL